MNTKNIKSTDRSVVLNPNGTLMIIGLILITLLVVWERFEGRPTQPGDAFAAPNAAPSRAESVQPCPSRRTCHLHSGRCAPREGNVDFTGTPARRRASIKEWRNERNTLALSVIPCAPMYRPNHFENAALPLVSGATFGNSQAFAPRSLICLLTYSRSPAPISWGCSGAYRRVTGHFGGRQPGAQPRLRSIFSLRSTAGLRRVSTRAI
jgi:hypothetical protein